LERLSRRRGKRMGSAEISAKHPNYISNGGGARATGVLG
jgi:UDP-N-acetylenolpyruvoylglucosamine reductase